MNATILNFLTTDGAVTVTLPKSLTPAQYDALYELIHEQHYTNNELCREVRAMAGDWQVEVVLDEC